MTIPNILTCIRAVLVPVFMVLAYQQDPLCQLLALIVYVVACATDFVDGYLARKWHQITDFGKFMDPVADKLLVMAALLIFVENGTVPAWAVAVILGREFIVSSLRMVAASSGKVIAANRWGKANADADLPAAAAGSHRADRQRDAAGSLHLDHRGADGHLRRYLYH